MRLPRLAREDLLLYHDRTGAVRRATSTAGWKRRRAEITRALVMRPKFMLLDEPFAGMNHDETMKAVELVRQVRAMGVTVLLVEHDMAAVMKISDRIVVLNFGEKIAEGTPAEIQSDRPLPGSTSASGQSSKLHRT